MKKIIALLAFLHTISYVQAQIRIVEDVYITFNQRSIPVYLIEGRYTAVCFDKTQITQAQLRDSITLKLVVDRIDSIYGFYKKICGQEPAGGWAAYANKCAVAFVPPSCGAACGRVGAKGIEVGPNMLNLIFNEHKYDTKTYRIGIVGYEFGRNFFTFGSKVFFPFDPNLNQTNGGFAEGFASFIGLLAFLDDCKSRPASYTEFQETYLNYDWLLNSFRAYYNDPTASPDSNLHKNKFIFDINRSYYGNYYGVYSGPILVGTYELFKNDIRWPDFFQSINSAPNASTKEVAMGNIALAFSAATRYNLNAYFRNVLKFRYPAQTETLINAFPRPTNRLIRDKDVLYFTDVNDTIYLNLRSINHALSPTTEYQIKLDGKQFPKSSGGQNSITYRHILGRDSLLLNVYLLENGSAIDSQSIVIKKRENIRLTSMKSQFFFGAGNGNSIPKYIDSTFVIQSVTNVENFPLFELIYPLRRNQRYSISAKISTKASKSPSNIDANGDGIIDYWARMFVGGGGGSDGTPRVGYDIAIDDTSYFNVNASINTNSYFTQNWATNLPYVLQKVYLEAAGVGVFRFRDPVIRNITDSDGDGITDFRDKCPFRINPPAPRPLDTTFYHRDRANFRAMAPPSGYQLVWYADNGANAVGDTTAPNFMSLGPGTYRYYVSYRSVSDLCETDRALYTIRMTSDGVVVYPSPNNGNFKVGLRTSVTDRYHVSITDSKGANVFNEVFIGQGNYQTFDVSLTGAARGIYLIQVKTQSGNVIATNKFIIH